MDQHLLSLKRLNFYKKSKNRIQYAIHNIICFGFYKEMKGNLLSIAMDPSFVAGKDEREPRNPPSGVRATPTIHTSVV